MLIYKIKNNITGKLYIGQTSKTITERFNAHLKCAKRKVNRYLYDSMNKHGYDNFTIELIEEVSTKNEADFREKYWIDYHNTFYPNGYNMTIGGGGGNTLYSYSDEDKKKIYKKQTLSRKGFKHTDETKKLLSSMKKGQIISDTQKKQISETLKKKYSTGEIVAILPPVRNGKEHHEWVDIDKDILLNLIKNEYTINVLCEYFNCSRPTVINRIKLYFSKTYNELRKEYGITNRKHKLE